MNDLKSRLNQAITAASEKDFDMALGICSKAIEEFPRLAEPFRTRSQVYRLMGDVGKAIDDRTSAIRIEAQSMDFFFRGWWHLDHGDFESALADLTEAINLDTDSDVKASTESSHFFRALTLLRLGRFDLTLADCVNVRDEFVIYVRGMGRLSKHEVVTCARERRKNPGELRGLPD